MQQLELGIKFLLIQIVVFKSLYKLQQLVYLLFGQDFTQMSVTNFHLQSQLTESDIRRSMEAAASTHAAAAKGCCS